MRLTTEQAEHALDALALIEGTYEDNPTNRDAVLRMVDPDDLIVGLTHLALKLAYLSAAHTNSTVAEVLLAHRHLLMLEAEHAL